MLCVAYLSPSGIQSRPDTPNIYPSHAGLGSITSAASDSIPSPWEQHPDASGFGMDAVIPAEKKASWFWPWLSLWSVLSVSPGTLAISHGGLNMHSPPPSYKSPAVCG